MIQISRGVLSNTHQCIIVSLVIYQTMSSDWAIPSWHAKQSPVQYILQYACINYILHRQNFDFIVNYI